ncbi:serine/threonine-protein kinase [Mycobacterium sp. ITM-2016-00318]|uniref:serine/threonine-protein kinase n=1 Tax=Mycobacterium sp. ITM-2016-00318 TaxID=2099693 RepID=UPI000CF8D8D0|nr:serine/threonine-protein kinase [Mycobacterium sp. ITM-2016-00318]WNG92517.1 serine/threonine-protein kinase [Mycobacterium sp. ITM-2016-00318]
MSGQEMLAARYELRGVLGCGGMAEVRDGWDTRLNRPVAIKLLHPALNVQPDIRRRFEDEARSAAALSHPNIVSVYDCGDDDGKPFIIMERLPGDTLHDHIAQGPLPPQRVQRVLDDMLAALTVAHSAGVLHRDIKPANVLVSSDGTTMKVADFGIAKTAGAAQTMTGQIIGTMAYMSPERIAGAPASVADDLYAVGVVGYEALTGLRAFPQDNPASLAHAVMNAPPPSVAAARPDIDPLLAGVIDRAMTPDKQQRFLSAEQMRAALAGDRSALFAGAAPAAAPRPATKILEQPVPIGGPGTFVSPYADFYVPPRRRRSLSRNQKLLAAAGALFALLVSGLALATDPSSSSRVTEPVSASTPVSTPPPPPPPPSVAPVLEQPEAPKDEKKDEEKKEEKKKEEGGGNGNEGGGNGNEGNQGGGDKKRE